MFGISEKSYQLIKRILLVFPEISTVKIFGSRALGNFKNGSDIDLALVGDKIEEEHIKELNALFLGSSIPYKIDLIHYNTITNDDLKKHIDDFGKKF